MKNRDDNPLLTEILGGAPLDDFRQSSLAFGLKAIRRRRRNHRIARTCAIGLPIIAILLAFLYHDITSPGHRSTLSGTASRLSVSPRLKTEVQIIDDDQLFALFPDRAVALIGKPGHQQLVFLDQLEPP
jgi:hypothetical protein